MSTPHCEQCGRQTEYLFQGIVIGKATRYVKSPNGRAKAIGKVDVERDGMVCWPCRPPSNLEIQDLIDSGKRLSKRRQVPAGAGPPTLSS